MSNVIQLRRSAVQSKIPTTAVLALGELAANTYDGALYLRGNNGSDFVTQIGAANHRQANWQPVGGLAAVQDFEFDEQIYRFSQGALQAITTWVRVPNTYIVGKQISLRLSFYAQSTSGYFRLQTVTSLVRSGTDAVNSTTNQNTVDSGDIANGATAYLLRTQTIALTDAAGKVNAVAVSPGDMLKVVLTRIATTGTDDSNDLRALPNSGEVQY